MYRYRSVFNASVSIARLETVPVVSHLYQSLASRLARSIDQGAYAPGDRLPGVRVASRNEGVSPATVVAAYGQLETDGYIESRPRSGFYVRPRRAASQAEPGLSEPPPVPRAVTGQQLVLQLIRNAARADVVQLGANLPNAQFLPTAAIARELKRVARQHTARLGDYGMPPGVAELRNGIARRMADLGCVANPNDILITNGCQEAIYLCLQAVTRPGDVVAVESPTYYGLLQVLDALGLKALEIPTHSRTGLSVDALQLALEQWPVRACVLVPNYSNPLGALMSDAQKAALLRLLKRHPQVTLIEDDIYGDLCFGARRPAPLQSGDTAAQVIYCSSFSKSLSAGLRIGWVHAPQRLESLMLQKFVHNCSTSVVNQLTLAGLLDNGSYERHLRGMRPALAQSVARLAERVARKFPADVRISRPQGGMSLWVELPRQVDTTALFNQASAQGVSVAPGQIFSTDPDKYRHCLRLNAGVNWTPPLDAAIDLLAGLVHRALD